MHLLQCLLLKINPGNFKHKYNSLDHIEPRSSLPLLPNPPHNLLLTSQVTPRLVSAMDRGYRAVLWQKGSLLQTTPCKKNDTYLPWPSTTYIPQVGVGPMKPFPLHAREWTGSILCRSCAIHDSCYEFMSAMTVHVQMMPFAGNLPCLQLL